MANNIFQAVSYPISGNPIDKDENMNSAIDGLLPFRERINHADQQIVALLAERFQICAEVAKYKKAHQIPMMQPDRVEAVKDRCAELGAKIGLEGAFVRQLYSLIIDEACRLEDDIIGA